MSKKVFTLTIVALVLVIVAGLAITASIVFAPDQFKTEINITSEETQTEVFEIKSLTMTPADELTYTFVLHSKVDGNFVGTFSFNEVQDGGLKNYVNVVFKYGDQTETKSLAEMLDGTSVSFNCTATKGKKEQITVTFLMPSSVGNEAQGTFSDFDIVFEKTQK